MSAPLGTTDFEQLEQALTALRNANSQSNTKSDKIKEWFSDRTGENVAVSYITEAKQIGNRLKEQRGKLAPYTLLFSASADISDRALARMDQYVYPNLRAVFFFVRTGGEYRLRTLAHGTKKDSLVEQIAHHYESVAPVKTVPLPEPKNVIWGEESAPAVEAAEDFEPLGNDDPVLQSVRNAIKDRYAGVILSGPPGTGKSRYAAQIALALVGGAAVRARFVQFHPSYQYEDFIQGYVPNGQAFEPKWKVFGQLCLDADADPNFLHVLVIDEFSRSDTARVFGETLTYIEMDKRGRTFTLASGSQMSVPSNIFIIATMNPWDRGVDDLDVALERRFAEISVQPTTEGLRSVLDSSSLSEGVRAGVIKFFESVQNMDNQYCHIGHAYFLHAKDNDSLLRLWQFRLRPFFRRACRSDKAQIQKIENIWRQLVAEVIQPPNKETEAVEA